MSWPLGIPLGGADPQSYLRLLLRLTPDGYSRDPDGPRATELEAYATALWVGRVAVDRAFAQAYPDRATELLEEWERVYDLPNDAARTLEQRQARLRSAERAVAGASRPRIEAALAEVAPHALALANARTEIEASAALDEMIWHIGVQLDASEFGAPATRRAVARVLRRMLPARLHPPPGFLTTNAARSALDGESQLFVTEGATWGGPELIGRAVLERQDASARAVREPTCRHREYAGLVRVDARDLNALQSLTLMRPCRGAGVLDTFPDAGTDQTLQHIAVAAAIGVETEIDTSIEWRNRHVMLALVHSTVDIRPGEAGDTSTTRTRAIGFLSTSTGDSTSLTGAHWTIATNLHVYARSSDGRLVIYNATGATAYVIGLAVASPDTSTQVGGIVDFADGDSFAAFDASFWSALTSAALARPSTTAAAAWADYPGPGALMRLGWVAGAEDDTAYVLDAEADWRDRAIAVACILVSPTRYSGTFEGVVFPGAPDDDASSNAFEGSPEQAISAGYTGTGISDPSSAHGYRIGVGTFAFVYADDADGSLRIYRTAGGADPLSMVALVIASEPLGQRASPAPASPSLAVSDSTQVEPHILNGFQDRALLGQCRDNRNTGEPNDCFALGPKLDPGGMPEFWARTLSPLLGAELRRQPVAGQAWRFFYASAAASAEVVLDTTVDWRDRVLFGAGRRSTTAGQPVANGGIAWNMARYTGPGESGALASRGYGLQLTSQLHIRARASDGALMLRNETASTQYVAGIIGASFQLGPRSV